MANDPYPVTSYQNTVAQKRVITDYIAMLDPSDAPFIEAIGGLDGASSKFRFVNKGTKVEWLEDNLAPLAGTLSMAASVAGSATTITAADANMLQPGHILKIGTELLWVSSVSPSTKEVVVTRGFGGTSTATIASTATFSIVGMARLEAAEATPIGTTPVSNDYNYTQIFEKEVRVSGTAQSIDFYGITNPMEYQEAKSIPEQMRLIELTLQNGQRSAGSSSTPRTMGGYEVFITSNTVQGSAFAVGVINSAAQKIYDAGGSGDFLAICNPSDFTKVQALFDNSAFVRYSPDQSVFGVEVQTVRTPFGNVNFLIDRWQKQGTIPMLTLENVGMLTLRPWTVTPLAKGGDYDREELTGEFTFCVKLEKSHALIKNVPA